MKMLKNFEILIFFTFFLYSSSLATDCKCGLVRSPRVRRITGGRDVPKGNQPWFAALTKYIKKENDITQPFCGGTLISSKYILTAGHCIYNKKPEDIRILLNFYDLNDYNETLHSHKAKKILVHSDYVDDKKLPKFDIGLIELEKEVIFNDEVLPVCLPDLKPENDNDTYYGFLTTVGWGRLGKNDELPEKLQLVKIFQDFDSCSLVFGNQIHDRHICVKDTRKIKTGWKDVCKGDSGGPLMIKKNNLYHIVGLTSFSNCLGIPAAVFTKVRVYFEWIKMNTKNSHYCEMK